MFMLRTAYVMRMSRIPYFHALTTHAPVPRDRDVRCKGRDRLGEAVLRRHCTTLVGIDGTRVALVATEDSTMIPRPAAARTRFPAAAQFSLMRAAHLTVRARPINYSIVLE